MRSWVSKVKRGAGCDDAVDPSLPPGDDRWYDWSPLHAPDWVFDPRFSACRPIDDRLALHFWSWWRPPERHERWLTVQTWSEDDAFVWWDLGDPNADPPRSPRIEVAVEFPPEDMMPDVLPWPVDRVGWWIVAGISFDEAHRWLQHGLAWPSSNHRWVTLLGRDIQVRFPGSRLAELRHGRWVPTEDGLNVVERLQQIGCRPHDFRPGEARDWASAAGGSIERGVELLQDWVTLVKQGPEYKPWSPAAHALRWLAFGIDIEEARDWVHSTGVNAYEAVAWRRQGFTPFGASLWRVEGLSVHPERVRALHLQLFGESHGLGPKPRYRKPCTWMAPQTREEKTAERRERWTERLAILQWNLRGRPG